MQREHVGTPGCVGKVLQRQMLTAHVGLYRLAGQRYMKSMLASNHAHQRFIKYHKSPA